MASLDVPRKSEKHCVKVFDFLYLGDRKAAKNLNLLESCGITHIVNVTVPKAQGGIHNYFESDKRFNYLRLPCIDSDNEDLSYHFEKAIAFIKNAICQRDGVLVHCQMGVSRSPTVVLAYMITLPQWSLKTGYVHLKNLRAAVKPKPNFLRQLIEFEKKQKQLEESIAKNKNQDKDKEKEKLSKNGKTEESIQCNHESKIKEKEKKRDDSLCKDTVKDVLKSNTKKKRAFTELDDIHIHIDANDKNDTNGANNTNGTNGSSNDMMDSNWEKIETVKEIEHVNDEFFQSPNKKRKLNSNVSKDSKPIINDAINLQKISQIKPDLSKVQS